MDEFIRAVAADDSGRIEPMPRADRLAQDGGGAVRIILEMVGKGAQGFAGAGRRPERCLIRRKLENLGAPGAELWPGT